MKSFDIQGPYDGIQNGYWLLEIMTSSQTLSLYSNLHASGEKDFHDLYTTSMICL